MELFKKLLLVNIIVFLLVYLLGCFYSVSFNISEWSEESRTATVFEYFFIAVFVSFFLIALNTKLNDNR